MSFISGTETILKHRYGRFWSWFAGKAAQLKGNLILQHTSRDVTDPVQNALQEVMPELFFLMGMENETIAELIITANGSPSRMGFAEELVAAAPPVPGWKFVALKQPLATADFEINTGNIPFNKQNIRFSPATDPDFPDEISLVFTHPALRTGKEKEAENCIMLYLEYLLGELTIATRVDYIECRPEKSIGNELIPVEKLGEYLNWREKEKLAQFKPIDTDPAFDAFTIYESGSSNCPVISVINTDLLEREGKAGYPWSGIIRFRYPGTGLKGLPSPAQRTALDKIEEEFCASLTSASGCLYIGKEYGNSEQALFFTAADFRPLAKAFYSAGQTFSAAFKIESEILRDPSWSDFAKYRA